MFPSDKWSFRSRVTFCTRQVNQLPSNKAIGRVVIEFSRVLIWSKLTKSSENRTRNRTSRISKNFKNLKNFQNGRRWFCSEGCIAQRCLGCDWSCIVLSVSTVSISTEWPKVSLDKGLAKENLPGSYFVLAQYFWVGFENIVIWMVILKLSL